MPNDVASVQCVKILESEKLYCQHPCELLNSRTELSLSGLTAMNPYLISLFTPYCQVPGDVNLYLISSFTPYCQVLWDVNPHLIIVCSCCSYFMFHAHTLDTCFKYKTINNSTHQFIDQYLRNLNLNRFFVILD